MNVKRLVVIKGMIIYELDELGLGRGVLDEYHKIELQTLWLPRIKLEIAIPHHSPKQI